VCVCVCVCVCVRLHEFVCVRACVARKDSIHVHSFQINTIRINDQMDATRCN